jgi:pimeloyl-ACP methyl ester carboxylesterase
MSASGVSRFVTAPDGLRLHVREYGERGSQHSPQHLPVVCLPGLSRTAEDFDALASAITADAATPRRVLALDYRGRGRSDILRRIAGGQFPNLGAADCSPQQSAGSGNKMAACSQPTTRRWHTISQP